VRLEPEILRIETPIVTIQPTIYAAESAVLILEASRDEITKIYYRSKEFLRRRRGTHGGKGTVPS
jgi:hypothetical protein